MNGNIVGRLHELGAVQFGDFTLKSGSHSPVYVDLRLLISDPALLQDIAEQYARLLSDLEYDRLAAIPYGGLPIGTAVSMLTGSPMVYPRKEVKLHGTAKQIEGRYETGETAVVLDDLISSGGSKLEAIEMLEHAGLIVNDVVVLIDREGGGADELSAAGYNLHSVITLSRIAYELEAEGRLATAEARAVLEYIAKERD